MSIYNKKISNRSDITEFVHFLLDEWEIDFHPDRCFEQYINYATKRPVFTPEGNALYDRVLDDCHAWCDAYGENIYQICREARQFPAFLKSHRVTEDPEAMKQFFTQIKEEDHPLGGIKTLHTYRGGNYVVECWPVVTPLFIATIANTYHRATNLRELELALFHSMAKVPSYSKQACPSKIESQEDIVQFLFYLTRDRGINFQPEKSFEEYMNLRTGEFTFIEEEREEFHKLLYQSRQWAKEHQKNFHQISADVNSFFEGYIRLTNPKKIDAHYRDFIDPSREQSPDLVALHVYQGGHWIEEMELHGEPHYRVVFGDVSGSSPNLREMEVDLFDDMDQQILRSRQSRRQ